MRSNEFLKVDGKELAKFEVSDWPAASNGIRSIHQLGDGRVFFFRRSGGDASYESRRISLNELNLMRASFGPARHFDYDVKSETPRYVDIVGNEMVLTSYPDHSDHLKMVAIDLDTGKTRPVFDSKIPGLRKTYEPQFHRGSLYIFATKNSSNNATVADSNSGPSVVDAKVHAATDRLIELNIESGKVTRVVLAPDGYVFENSFVMRSNRELILSAEKVSRREAEEYRSQTSQPEHAIFKVYPTEDSTILVNEISSVIQPAFFHPESFVVNDKWLYFVASLPKRLSTFENGDRAGNYAIFRLPIED